jgi:hypothetical protein
MAVEHYELDREVFTYLQPGIGSIGDWKGKASGIGEYVASWGLERFWAMSRSPVLKGGGLPDAEAGSSEQRNYFAWAVARIVLCRIVDNTININQDLTTAQFQERLSQLNFNQQVLLTDLLIEIAETIQFWTMRIADAQNNQV